MAGAWSACSMNGSRRHRADTVRTTCPRPAMHCQRKQTCARAPLREVILDPMMVTIKKILLIQHSVLLLLLASRMQVCQAFGLQLTPSDGAPRYNVSYIKENSNPSGLASLFSPRMDFEQWKPLTGRGDPLRNDPTYDYEPPVLERVHYWADDTRLEREHYPEKKSEVLMLGVSSRKPSVTSRQPPLPPRRQQQYRPLPPKYEDFTYKLSDTYPMTILVPPPLPPPGHQPSLFILNQEKISLPNSHIKMTDAPHLAYKDNTSPPEKLTSTYALQEANLIYQSSSTIQSWIRDVNHSLSPNINDVVSSDYAGWGPTTPINEYDSANESHNIISNDYVEISKTPYSFYRPMLSEAPPPPIEQRFPTVKSTFLPTTLPATSHFEQTTPSLSQITWPSKQTTLETSTEMQDYYEDTTTEKATTVVFSPTENVHESTKNTKLEATIFDMLGPMMSMPILNGPDRAEDNLYAHATENMQVFKERNPENDLKLENMQTMQPPPPVKFAESATVSPNQPYHVNSNFDITLHNKPLHTYDPYLHMRYTTPVTTTTSVDHFDKNESPTEVSVPMYLIIQGHSKVKTYSSKPKSGVDKHTISNDIPKPNETDEVKHLHPIKGKSAKKLNLTEGSRTNRAKNLKALIDQGHGSIEIQEADVGIKYDVSDGSEVPIELYRKGIVDSDENAYKSSKENQKQKRIKKQIDLEDLLPFNEDSIEEYVFNYLEGKKNATGLTGLLAQVVTSDAADAVDELEEGDDEPDGDQQER